MEIEIIVPLRNNASRFYRLFYNIKKQLAQAQDGGIGCCVVDDCSDTHDAEEIRRLVEGEHGFRLVRLNDRRNAGGARNEGARTSAAKYLAFCDADDNIVDNYCAELLDAVKANAGVDLILFGFTTITKDGSSVWLPRFEDTANEYALSPIGIWCKCIRRECYVDFPERVFCEDCSQWFLQADKVETITTIEKPLYIYDKTVDGAFSRTLEQFSRFPRTLEDLAYNNIIIAEGGNDKTPSDVLRNLAEMYDIRNTLKKPQVRSAWARRFHEIYSNILCGRWSF